MLMANGTAGWIAIELGARAGVHAPVSACASGSEAIGYAIAMIRSGRADVVVAGGTEAPLMPFSFAVFTQLRVLSYNNADPERASRPFDKGRDGFVLGEGAGIMVLESAQHAAQRGAAVHAIAAGAGYSADARHLTQPDPDGVGAAAAIQSALADAGVAPDQVVHINAHATATAMGDAAEAVAIRRALGSAANSSVISATKSMTGHLLGGSGGVESIAVICALRDGVAPPTVNLDDIDDEVAATGIDIAREPRELRAIPGAVALNNSFGFGGHNVTLAFSSARR
jgi:3-oxoacyl-[acyl-carrier-protein] synthase II